MRRFLHSLALAAALCLDAIGAHAQSVIGYASSLATQQRIVPGQFSTVLRTDINVLYSWVAGPNCSPADTLHVQPNAGGGCWVDVGPPPSGVLALLSFGTYFTGTSYNGSAPVTLGINATSLDTASTIVARDPSGNFSAGTITASLTGHASLDLALSGGTMAGAIAMGGYNITGAGILSATTLTGTLSTAAQPNITSLGILSSELVVSAAYSAPSSNQGVIAAGATYGLILSGNSAGNDVSIFSLAGEAAYVPHNTTNFTVVGNFAAGNLSLGGTLTTTEALTTSGTAAITLALGNSAGTITLSGLVGKSALATDLSNLASNTTPAFGAFSGTSLALGGASIGSNQLALNGFLAQTISTSGGASNAALNLEITDTGTTTNGNYQPFYWLLNDSLNDTAAGTPFIDGLTFTHNINPGNLSAAYGGRQSIAVYTNLIHSTGAGNPNHNFVAGNFAFTFESGDGGTSGCTTGPTIADCVGAGFGVGVYGLATSGATNLLEVTPGEADVSLPTGTSAGLKIGWSIADMTNDAVHGSILDAGLGIGSQALGFEIGIAFHPYNGANPITTTGTLLASVGSATVGTGIDFSSYTFSTNLITFGTNLWRVDAIGDTITSGFYYGVNNSGGSYFTSGSYAFAVGGGFVGHEVDLVNADNSGVGFNLYQKTGASAQTLLASFAPAGLSFKEVSTFIASGINLLGSSTGATTFASANASGTNYTLTFPAATDTVALLGTAQTITALKTLQGSGSSVLEFLRTANTVDNNGQTYFTGATEDWFLGERSLSTSHLYLYGFHLGANVLDINDQTGLVTLGYNETVTGTLTVSGIGSGGGTGAVCETAGLLTYDTSGTICGLSALFSKNLLDNRDQLITPDTALARMTEFLRPGVPWQYKAGYEDNGVLTHVGLIADDVAKMDPRCGDYDKDGKLMNYSDRCVEAYTVNAVTALNARVDQVERRLSGGTK